MSRAQSIGDFKYKHQYTTVAEKCGNCKHYKKGFTLLINSMPRTQMPQCTLGEFNTRSYSICNLWEEK